MEAREIRETADRVGRVFQTQSADCYRLCIYNSKTLVIDVWSTTDWEISPFSCCKVSLVLFSLPGKVVKIFKWCLIKT